MEKTNEKSQLLGQKRDRRTLKLARSPEFTCFETGNTEHVGEDVAQAS